MPQPSRFALSVMCEDKVGLVARLTSTVCSLDGDIEVLDQGVLQGYFVFMLLVTFKDEVKADEVKAAIESAGGPGEFVVSILPRRQQTIAPPTTGFPFILTITGKDAAMILTKATAYLADHRINIEGLTSQTADGECLITARLTIPEPVDVRSARLDLSEILKPHVAGVSLMHEDIFAATSQIGMPRKSSQ
jgi:predicted amino acid-binding ACT domain protein